MIKEELIKRSPLRIFEQTLNGGLAAGDLGVLTARKGVGKTASLVHIATDKLLRGQNVLHISFADDPKHIINWYEQVFREVAKAYRLENVMDVHDDLVRHRLILHFKNSHITFPEIENNIDQMTAGLQGHPDTIIIDGYDFEHEKPEALNVWKEYAERKGVAIWFSATLHREHLDMDNNGIPAPVNRYNEMFSIIIMLHPLADYIEFKLLKSDSALRDQKLHVKLDPQTLLISNHRV